MVKTISDARLHLITDRTLCGEHSLEESVAEAVEGGVHAVHVREHNMSSDDLYALARRLRQITLGKALLIVNSRIDIALAIPADGVHLPSNSLPVSVGKQLVNGLLLVGRSVHTVKQAIDAQVEGADYIFLGTIFHSWTHPDALPAGPDLIRQVKDKVDLPLFGIGGINVKNARLVIDSGARGIAVIRSILSASDRRVATQELLNTIQGIDI